MFFSKNKITKKVLGFSFIEIMLVSAIVSSVPYGGYIRAKNMAKQTECINNLKQIGQAYLMFYNTEGYYPSAVFYPKKPLKDKNSIVNVLSANNSALKKMFVCPGLPEKLARKGLTFVFNDKWNKRKFLKNPSKAWVLVEINAVSQKAPKAHPKGYNVLFADGHVLSVDKKHLPASLTAMHKAQIDKIEFYFNNSLHSPVLKNICL